MKKYELVKSSKIVYGGTTLYRIKALIDIPNIVKAGELGGYIESEKNLSHEGHKYMEMHKYVEMYMYLVMQRYMMMQLY